jgi:hypothetical protein
MSHGEDVYEQERVQRRVDLPLGNNCIVQVAMPNSRFVVT